MFTLCVCLFVCVCLCLSRCLSGQFDYEGLVPHKQYFAGTLLGMSSCASYVSRTHDVLTSKCRKCSWLSSWYIQLSVKFPVKKFVASSKLRPFWNIKHSFHLTSDIKRLSQIMQKHFHGDDVIDDVTGWPQSFPPYSCLGELGSGSKL